MKVYNKEYTEGMWILRCPACGTVQASACEEDLLPEFTTCECDDARRVMGKRIAELRKEKGLSQAALSALTGIAPGNIARIETGRYSTGIDILDKIAKALKCRVDLVEQNQ